MEKGGGGAGIAMDAYNRTRHARTQSHSGILESCRGMHNAQTLFLSSSYAEHVAHNVALNVCSLKESG